MIVRLVEKYEEILWFISSPFNVTRKSKIALQGYSVDLDTEE